MGWSRLSGLRSFTFGAAAVCGLALPAVALANDVETKFLEMDTNSDGKVSPDEHAQWASRMFARMDENLDGKVTASEMTAAQEAQGKMDKMGGKKAEKGEMTAAEKVKKFDTNGDGVLTADEHDAAAHSLFQQMDTDHDGYLTRAELKAGHEKMVRKASK